MFSRALRFVGVFSVFSLLGTGCVNTAKQTVAPPASDVPTVQRSASFANVSVAYRAGDYTKALAQINVLSRSRVLSPADRLFLERQEAICREALSKRTPDGSSRLITVKTDAAKATPAPPSDCGPRALHFVCQELGVPASLPALTKMAGTKPDVGSNLAGLSRAAHSVGLTASGVQVDADALRRIATPAIAWVDGDHFVAVTRVKDDTATIYDPNKTGKEEVTLDTLHRRSGGVLLVVKRPQPNVTKK